jgi:hypothetical protein
VTMTATRSPFVHGLAVGSRGALRSLNIEMPFWLLQYRFEIFESCRVKFTVLSWTKSGSGVSMAVQRYPPTRGREAGLRRVPSSFWDNWVFIFLALAASIFE